ncbi:hypothetical protein HK104_008870 [Borealophlyctis nickersoniae]|nr:hypothetical protein HK104_008870 [Borealophlyctis nickersoniae]
MNNYEPLEVIGSGSFGVIRKVRRKSDGRILARKEIDYRKMSEKEKKQLVAEVNILRELRHPHIVRYYERIVDRESCLIYIIMEYCEGGDLSAIIRKCKKEGRRIAEDVIWNLLAQLLQALHACHQGGIGKTGSHPVVLHRDIKPDNGITKHIALEKLRKLTPSLCVVVFLDGTQNVKLGDFGLSRVIEDPETEFARTYVGVSHLRIMHFGAALSSEKSKRPGFQNIVWQSSSPTTAVFEGSRSYSTSDAANKRMLALSSGVAGKFGEAILIPEQQAKRPSAGDFLKLDRIRQVIQERERSQHRMEMKRAEEERRMEMKRAEEELSKREEALRVREATIAQRELALAAREEELKRFVATREEELRRMLVAKEEEIVQREARVVEKEQALQVFERQRGTVGAFGTRERKPFEERYANG